MIRKVRMSQSERVNMIEITAKLVRGPVYFSGEIIECLVTFTNPPNPNHQISQSHR